MVWSIIMPTDMGEFDLTEILTSIPETTAATEEGGGEY